MTEEATPATFIAALGMDFWIEDGATRGRAELGPLTWAPGTDRPRIGALATMVDLVVGMPPGGPITPTIDLRVSLLARPPMSGPVHLVCRPAKVGRRLFVAEVVLAAAGAERPFAWGAATFFNQGMDVGPPPSGPRPVVRASSIDELLGVRYPDQHTAEIDYHPGVSNGPGGTIQGGAQALLGEMAAERALAGRGPFTVNDLEIRYLNRVAVGPLVATAEVLAAGDDEATVRVPLVDRGNAGRLVSLVTAVCRRTVEESDEPARFA